MFALVAAALAQDPDCPSWGGKDPAFGDEPAPWEFRGRGAKLRERSAADADVPRVEVAPAFLDEPETNCS